jgi:holo-[acyl-carrier protein] synthase
VIVGLGVDIVDVTDFRARLTEGFLTEVFLPEEIAYCVTQARSWENYAARFAAKAAAFKALGAGLGNGLSWHDVEIVRRAGGELLLRLEGGARALSDEKDIAASFLSVAHSRRSALAVVVLER